MTTRRPLIPVVLAAGAALAPAAAAQSPPPTLSWDRACYTEHQQMVFSGTGYTPGGAVELRFTRAGSSIGAFETTADAAGGLADFVMADEEQVLSDAEERERVGASAGDQTRADQGVQPAESTLTTFTFTRWMGFSPARYVPGRKAPVEIFGWAFAEGRPAYFLFRRGRRTVASVNLGTIAGPCGDLTARAKVPRKLRAGTYKVWLSTDPRRPSERSTWRWAKVTKKAAAAAAATAPRRMHRA